MSGYSKKELESLQYWTANDPNTIKFQKTCAMCLEIKENTLFSIHKARVDGRRRICLECSRRANRERYKVRKLDPVFESKRLNKNKKRNEQNLAKWGSLDPFLDQSKKRCNKCLNFRRRIEFYPNKYADDGLCGACIDCSQKMVISYRFKNKEKVLLAGAKKRAIKENLEFNLSITDIVLPETCPVFGIPMQMHTGKPGPDSFSIDRIDPNRGYTKDNIQIICLRANKIKSDATLEELETIVMYLKKLKNEGSSRG